MRAINDDSEKCHAVEKRLSRNVADETIGDEPAVIYQTLPGLEKFFNPNLC